jgi:hypothetical protein
MSLSALPQSASPAASEARRPAVHDLHASLYREIGISAVAAVLQISNEARASREGKRRVHPLPAFLQGHDRAA